MKDAGITVQAARESLLRAIKNENIGEETVPLDQAAGRILAESIRSAFAMPPFSRSAMDGFALQAGSLGASEQMLNIVGTIGAGERYARLVGPGEAVRIMTGAEIPAGCDTVVPQEQCTWNNSSVLIHGGVVKGANVIAAGEECAAGTALLKAGQVLDGPSLAVIAGTGVGTVRVYRRLRILLLTSGRELIMPGKPLPPGKIYNSNQFLLRPLIQAQGCEVVHACHVSDGPEEFGVEISKVEKLITDLSIDVVISTGGVSVGDYDVMPQLFERLGAKTLYRRLIMRPGAASYGGVGSASKQVLEGSKSERGETEHGETEHDETDNYRRVLYLGLSGNPAAAFHAFWLLAAPVLRRWQGRTDWEPRILRCRLGEPVDKHNPVDRYIDGFIRQDEGRELTFYPLTAASAGSALLILPQSRALACLPQGSTGWHKGAELEAMILE